ncbi:MAG: signal peptide peptidase SppA [Saprospiraceae bacterium]|nr:signal peptide peptidase SppA [Saprospiraceae bacterium]
MGQFFKFLLASCLGVFLALILVFVIGIAIISSIASSIDKPEKISPNSVLHLTFEKQIPERTNNVQVTSFDPNEEKILGLQDILKALEHAKNDDNIKGIFLDAPNGVLAGMTTTTTLREALKDFKSSGKFIISYGDYYTQGSYYMSTVSDQIIVNPMGLIDFRGFSSEVAFYKNMLDKIGAHVEVFYAGKYKSATEPFRRTNMSEESKMQVREYLDQVYGDFLKEISEARSISIPDLRKIADGYQAFQVDEALRLKVVDKVGYRDDAIVALREKLGLSEDEKIRTVSIEKYFAANPPKTNYNVKDKIAVVYAEGNILDGKTEYGTIGSRNYSKILQEVRKDNKIKAVVLRVNSRGGSTIASENIWYELKQIKDEGIPIIVSMGDYAASGGYYIACLADSIVAEPSTLTGSIGVFATIPIVQKLLNEKLGITFDTVRTGPFSVGINPVFEMSEAEKKLLQARTDKSYELFLQRVAEGRGMKRDQVHEIAQGRVWTGQKAKDIGLVDALGDLDKALDIAASAAGVENYRLVEYPRTKDPFQQFMESFFEEDESVRTDQLIKTELRDWYPYYQMIKEIHDSKGVQAKLPFVIRFN